MSGRANTSTCWQKKREREGCYDKLMLNIRADNSSSIGFPSLGRFPLSLGSPDATKQPVGGSGLRPGREGHAGPRTRWAHACRLGLRPPPPAAPSHASSRVGSGTVSASAVMGNGHLPTVLVTMFPASHLAPGHFLERLRVVIATQDPEP